jgi:hypothetical protein
VKEEPGGEGVRLSGGLKRPDNSSFAPPGPGVEKNGLTWSIVRDCWMWGMVRFLGRFEVEVVVAEGAITDSEVSFSWIGEGVEEEEGEVPAVVVVMESVAFEDTG